MNLQSPRIPTRSKKEKAIDFDLNQISSSLDTINSSGYTKTIVNISLAQILSMGTTPIELLPAAGVNSYYSYREIIVESTGSGINGPYLMLLRDANGAASAASTMMQDFYNEGGIWITTTFANRFGNKVGEVGQVLKNENLVLTTIDGSNPIGSGSTLRAIIYHKTITFGS